MPRLTYNNRSLRWHLRVYKAAARIAMKRLDPASHDYFGDPSRPQRFREEIEGMVGKAISWDADLSARRARPQPAPK